MGFMDYKTTRDKEVERDRKWSSLGFVKETRDKRQERKDEYKAELKRLRRRGGDDEKRRWL